MAQCVQSMGLEAKRKPKGMEVWLKISTRLTAAEEVPEGLACQPKPPKNIKNHSKSITICVQSCEEMRMMAPSTVGRKSCAMRCEFGILAARFAHDPPKI